MTFSPNAKRLYDDWIKAEQNVVALMNVVLIAGLDRTASQGQRQAVEEAIAQLPAAEKARRERWFDLAMALGVSILP
jgi:hypothetical protein